MCDWKGWCRERGDAEMCGGNGDGEMCRKVEVCGGKGCGGKGCRNERFALSYNSYLYPYNGVALIGVTSQWILSVRFGEAGRRVRREEERTRKRRGLVGFGWA